MKMRLAALLLVASALLWLATRQVRAHNPLDGFPELNNGALLAPGLHSYVVKSQLTATATSVSLPPTRPAQTPLQPIPEEGEARRESDPASLASRSVLWAFGLQVFALMLGIYVALRRPSGGAGGAAADPVDADEDLD